MPTVIELPFDHNIISLSVERDTKRSSGVHLSEIIRDRLLTAGISKSKNKEWPEQDKHMLFESGFLWERLISEYISTDEWKRIEWDWYVENIGLTPLINDSIVNSSGDILRPGECILDGVAMTPDAVNMKLWHLEEWKATSIYAKGFDPLKRKPEWIWQCASYCKFYNMTRTILRVWHYSQMPHCVKQFVLEFTTQEIDDTWNQMLEHHRYMNRRANVY